MKITQVVEDFEMGMDESQNQRDNRVEDLWRKLDPQGTGELDLKRLQKGLRRIDHRQLGPRLAVLCTRRPANALGQL